MRVVLIAFCVVLLVTSCGEKVIEEPENLIPQEKMESILYDLAVLEGVRNSNNLLLRKHNIKIMPFIFDKYKVDSIQFTESDEYYASQPSTYQTIYETLLERLENEEKAIGDAKKRRNDSLTNLSKRRKDSLRQLDKSKVSDSLPKK